MKISRANSIRFSGSGTRCFWALLMVAWMVPASVFAVPTVSSTDPATGATAVPLAQVITVTFSEAMNPLTVVTFTVTDPTGTVPGVVSNPTTTTAVFTPDYLLAATSIPFTATITTGATAVAGGTPLASNYVWTFTTGPLAPVTLGSTANFVILAGADISDPGTSVIIGDVGASPIAGSGITGITDPEVDGFIYTTSAGGPAGETVNATLLTAAKGDLTIAYGDAAARTPTPVGAHYLNPGAGDLGGLTLAGGLYKFTGAAGISGSDLTLTGSANDVWIFQIASTLTVANGIKVTLTGGAQAANVFWRAPSGAPIGTTAEMKGTILSDAAITLNTGAKLDGRALAFTAGITLLSNTITRPDITAPTVSSTVPVSAAIGVSLSQAITATFSESMLPSSLTTTTFTLTGPGSTPVAGVVTRPTTTTATFTPSVSLAANTLYTATITTGAKDSASHPLASSYIWTFNSTDTNAPTVSSTVPDNTTTGAGINANITATFSEAMLSGTLTATTFTLTGPGSTPVAGAVTYTGTTATFDPTSALTVNTLYTATITTGAQDLGSNPLASNYVWTFTTGASPTVSSTIPVAAATGVATNQSITATFSEAMLASSLSTTTFTVFNGTTQVTGVVTRPTTTTATFTPNALLNGSTLYTATITTGATNLASNGLASNYVWTFTTVAAPDVASPTVTSTTPASGASGVALNKQFAATFSEPMLASTLTNTTFTVTAPGGALGGTVTYTGTTATFAPTAGLAPNTVLTATITTGAKDLAGNALAGNYVWTFTTGAAADFNLPTVSSVDPAPGATNVARNQQIAATFSEAMLPSTITDTSFTVTGPGTTPVPGTVTNVGLTATFAPDSTLAANTLFTASINAKAKDLAGNALVGYGWSFTTGAAIDLIAPTVSFTATANGATGVDINSSRAVTFSEAMDPLTITTETFTLTGPGATPVAGTVTYVGRTATFAPTSPLAVQTLYTATVTTGATDLGGNPLASDYVWHFTTGAAPDLTAPTVSSTAPTRAATSVALNQRIAAIFSEAMDPLTVTTETFTLTGPLAAPVPGLVTYVGLTATFDPTDELAANTPYTATIISGDNGVRDLAGNPKVGNYVWSFITGAVPDLIAPTASSTDPATDATNVALNKKIAVTLSEAMDPGTITNIIFTVTEADGTPVPGTVAYVGRVATFTPTDALPANTSFTATMATGAEDLAGNPLASDYVWNFATGAAPDLIIPTMAAIDPAKGATNVARNQQIAATFSESMDPLTITTQTFTVAGPDTTPVLGAVTYVGRTATFAPASALAANTLFTATITTGAKDLAGNARTSNYVWTFTTGSDSSALLPAQAQVNLQSTADFAVLAGAAITNVPTSAITGNIGLSPAAGSFITGFGSTEVTGTIYAVDATYPTTNVAVIDPVLLATAKGDLTSAYNDAAGRTPIPTGAFLDPGVGNLGGLTLGPGLYKFTGAALISGSDLTLKGNATDVWIFQIGSDLTVANGIKVILTGGAQAANIFWQVGTSATLKLGSVMQGTILADQSITLGTGATLNGRALASSAAVTLQNAVVTLPTADTAAPTVSSTTPALGATNVGLNQAIAAILGEAMDPETITSTTFKVTGPGATPVPGNVSYAGTTATFTPTSSFAPNTLFTATITTGAKDLAGNPLASDQVWTFTTGAAADLTAPTVSSTAPASQGTNVARNQQVTATFNEAMQPSTITTITFKVTGPGATPVLGVVTYTGTTATFAPTNPLAADTVFTATITTEVKDLAGNPLAANHVWSFTTGIPADFNASGKVDFDDFFLFSDAFGLPATGANVIYDLDGSAMTDFGDFFLFADDFGRSTGKVVASPPLPMVKGSLALESRSVEEGLILGLRAENLPLRGYMAVVEYDPSAFRFALAQDQQSVLRRQGEALLLSREEQSGQVMLLGSGAGQTLAAEGLLAELRFVPLRPEAVGTFRVRQALVRGGTGQLSQPEQLGQVEARWIPQVFALQPNYPNPFNPETTILYQLPISSPVRLEIYDVLGQKVRTLVSQVQPAGFHRVMWDSRNEGGMLVAAGVYFYRLQAGDFVQVRNLLLLK